MEEEIVNKIQLSGTWRGRVLNIAAGMVCLAVATGLGLNAAPLYSNGTPTTTWSGASSVPSDNTNSGYTVFDSFTTGPIGWNPTQFDITEWFVGSTPGTTRNVNWSIWTGSPLNNGTLVASSPLGGTMGTIGSLNGQINCGNSGIACYATITVNLTSGIFLLPNTTYYLGSSVVAANGSDYTARATVGSGGPNNGWEQSTGSISGSAWSVPGTSPVCPSSGNGYANSTATCTSNGGTAFDINGVLTPEPGTIILMSLAMLGLGYKVRQRA